MKIKKTSIIAMALALALSIGLIPVNAYAAQAQPTAQSEPKAEQVAANINYDITVTFNGEAKALSNVNGQQVYPVLYGGTTYVPIRAIGYLLGLKVDWDQATRTVLLDKPADGQTADIKTAKPDSPKKTGTEAIKPTIDPGITVKYNGEVQTMKTATGAVVYPMIDGGTTYLPIRAVGNMLGLDVDWEQSTQTVKLTGKAAGQDITVDTPKGKIVINTGDSVESITKKLSDAGVDATGIKMILAAFVNKPVSNDTGESTNKNTTIEGARAYTEYFSVDWSTAGDSYIIAKTDAKLDKAVHGKLYIAWKDSTGEAQSTSWDLTPGIEYNIPLEGGSTEYTVSVRPVGKVCKHLMTDEQYELSATVPTLAAKFTAEIADPDSLYLVSRPDMDYKNAPEVYAKALELTKNCKTDAEKITAVFNWVSSNIKYDYAEAARLSNGNKQPETCAQNPSSSNHWDYSGNNYTELNDTMSTKSGVCEHYAILTTAMLRSVGVQCRYVGGVAYPDGINNEGDGHAWVAVNPKTGELNMAALGAGKDYRPAEIGETHNMHPTGWIRLDPTWNSTAGAEGRAAASIDTNYHAEIVK